MITTFKRALAALTACFGLALPAAASTFSATDYTDLWGTTAPLENGWGVNLIQQGDNIFATLFVYGSDSSARWYSASNMTSGNGTSWSGGLAQTTGPYFGAAWTANATPVVVGSMTINFSGPNSGVLTYTVGSVSVTKNITRFSQRANNLAGNYLGGLTARCSNNQLIFIFDNLTVTHSGGTAINLRVDWFPSATVQGTCNFNGTYTSQGRVAQINGNYTCTYTNGAAGNNGTFTITSVEASQNGFNGAFTGGDQFCSSMTGKFGGIKDVL
jgi:hypothetical protein